MLQFVDFCWLGTYEKATRQQGGLFSRENSSNGGVKKTVKTFWRNLMSRKLGCQANFGEINPLFSVDCTKVARKPEMVHFETKSYCKRFNLH
jgi:hypothetical protein